MAEYRRWFVPGGTYFFTLVTENRAPLFNETRARSLLHDAISATRQRWPFNLDAIVLLPDHLHMFWTLPATDQDYPRRLAALKRSFTSAWLAAGGDEQTTNAAKQSQRRRGIWQRRYWEHTIRDETDFGRHLDYIHYNPVKHRVASCPHAWPYSTFMQWVQRGCYAPEWGCACNGQQAVPMRFDDLRETAME